jgi:hypothetical protein
VKECAYPEGLDCVWLASDRDGRVGAFTTAGEGPIPALALLPQRPPIEEIESLLYELPAITSAKLLVSLPRPDDFLNFAARGLFAYDWTDVHRVAAAELNSYEQLAVPDAPITAGQLPKDIAPLVEGIILNVSFAHERFIDVTKYLECRRAP